MFPNNASTGGPAISDPVANPLPLDLDPDQSTKVFLMVRTMHWLTLQNHQAQKRVGTVG
jgi:hypothetical protein